MVSRIFSFNKHPHKTVRPTHVNVIDKLISEINDNSPNFTQAYFDTCFFTEKQINSLANAIKGNKHLEYINLYDCHLSPQNLQKLLAALQENNSIRKIIINKDIGEELYTAFMDAASKKDNLSCKK